MLPICGSAPAKEKNAFKLSNNLHESYTLYKRMTSAVVQWLTKEGGSVITTKAKNNSARSKKKAAKKAKAQGSNRDGSKAQTSAKPSVARLRDFASCVAEKAVIVPDGVYYALKEAINVRKAFTARLGKQHTIEGSESALSHDHFTQNLGSIYETLGGPQWEETRKQSVVADDGEQQDPFSNSFAALETLFEKLELEEPSERHPLADVDAPPKKKVEDDGFAIKDDFLSDQIKILLYIIELDTLLKQAIVCWVKVADGSMSPLLASWICNNAMRGVRQNVYEYASQMVPLFDHKNLMWMWEGLYPEVGEDDGNVENDWITWTDADCEGDFALPLYGQIPSQMLINLYEGKRLLDDVEFDDDDIIDSIVVDKFLIGSCLETLGELCRRKGDGLAAIAMHPLRENIERYLQREHNAVHTGQVIGLQLLAESYKVCPPKKFDIKGRTHSHLSSLKQQLEDALFDSTLKCKCRECGSKNLSLDLLDFRKILKEQLDTSPDDIYFTTPWTVSQQALQLFIGGNVLGMRLCGVSNYLATVLHLYHVLRSFDIMEKIPLFENLCRIFQDMIFGGPPATRNFYSQYLISQGFKLHRDDRGKRQGPISKEPAYLERLEPTPTRKLFSLQDGGQSSWKLRPPRAGEKKTKNLEPNKLSLFVGIDYNAYFLDNATIYDIYNASTPKERRRAKWEYENMPYSHILTKMTSTVEKEFTDPFPIARLNYFAIYKVIVDILRRLANGGHESWCRPECMPTKERPHFEAKYQCGTTTSAVDGANMIVALLEGIDTYVVDEMKTSMLGGYHQFELCKRVFGECMQEKRLEDFVWDI